ncbi:hypothetical protein [Anoxynatronum buryatiense]|uniref:Uncharacterized protein n=1 Tax=Anoxynatronum buryatiense TaxID=489973 RepID=A0AA45WYD6_9CLOT|nr:hypothetical protein [Anoxynatronum buryatiense]SMP68580.1 hypothetical protein SAMN06296020_11724 [Anoxynatronum buryatiense]
MNFKRHLIIKNLLIFCLLIIIGYLYFELNSFKNHYQIESEKEKQLLETVVRLEEEIDYLNKRQIKEAEVLYLIEKLKDSGFTRSYGDGHTWYIAAEELGMIGKPAIPYLIENIETQDDYERALTFYALLLASQHENVKEFAGRDYIITYLDFDVERHEEMKKVAYQWWKKHRHNWD